MPKSKRCIVCRKRNILNMECTKCGKIICIVHRYLEDHNCTYDFNTEGRKQLEKDNEKVISEKVSLI